mgnify:CR=1 FL=1
MNRFRSILAIVLALTLLAYNRRVARKVVAISHEVQSIGEGNLYLQLEPKGSDELAQLTASVEQMRLSLLRKTSEEQRALQQNSDLITAMSHDIRNPLTALLGYLDLAKTGQYRTQEELQSYLDAAYGKAEQLKRLTDELFRYSLLFGCKELPLQLERYDASILLGQLLGESRAQLQQQGFTVQLLLPQQDVQIEADVTYLKRVFDNLFDNIRKYADPARPVAIAALLEDGELHVCLSNSVNPGAGRIESNKIGLRTCAKIMSQMAGGFTRYTENGKFTAEVILPIVEGCTVNTKYGPVKTDYMLFIAAGAFHVAKVTDLIPELQGRFPVRVNLKPLTREDFKAILSQTDNALTRQYEALLAVDHVHLHFEESALDALAQAAQQENETREDIGARRLHTLFEKMLEDISFNAGGDMPDVDVTINGDYVAEHLGGNGKKLDMRQYIL